MDVALRVLVDPALVAAVLGRVDRRHQRRVEAPREVVARHRHEPVVSVDEVEIIAIAELDPGGEHVGVHALDPGDELAEVGGAGGLAHAMNVHATEKLFLRRLLATAREHVHLGLVRQVLRELSHVTREPALDQRRVLPGQDQDSVHCFKVVRCVLGLEQGAQAQVRREVAKAASGGSAAEFMASSRASAWSVERR